MWSRMVLAGAVSLLVAFQIVRNGLVQEKKPTAAASLLSPRHPQVLRATGMAGVGAAAAAGEEPSVATIEKFRSLALAAPRAPDPFLVQAALAAKKADIPHAERLLHHALRRDPRSKAGRYLLAELYLQSGRPAEALQEVARLTLIMPGSAASLAGAFEEFARLGGTGAQLRQVFAINPRLENEVLNALAENPDNVGLIVAAASRGSMQANGGPPAWQETLLSGLVERGQYRKAYQLWLGLIDSSPSQAGRIFNPKYVSTSAPPPFNWTFTANAAGFAEGDNGRLHVVHYGVKNVGLAKQLLLLAPGAYRLSTSISGSIPAENQLTWSLMCLPSDRLVIAAPLPPQGGKLSSQFKIPGDSCEAQQLELNGRGLEPVEVADVHIGPIQLERVQ